MDLIKRRAKKLVYLGDVKKKNGGGGWGQSLEKKVGKTRCITMQDHKHIEWERPWGGAEGYLLNSSTSMRACLPTHLFPGPEACGRSGKPCSIHTHHLCTVCVLEPPRGIFTVVHYLYDNISISIGLRMVHTLCVLFLYEKC